MYSYQWREDAGSSLANHPGLLGKLQTSEFLYQKLKWMFPKHLRLSSTLHSQVHTHMAHIPSMCTHPHMHAYAPICNHTHISTQTSHMFKPTYAHIPTTWRHPHQHMHTSTYSHNPPTCTHTQTYTHPCMYTYPLMHTCTLHTYTYS